MTLLNTNKICTPKSIVPFDFYDFMMIPNSYSKNNFKTKTNET